MIAASARALLAGVVDYAGLFPPAALAMEAAAAEYARWRRSGEAWMLGRFVLPAPRLAELARMGPLPEPGRAGPWRLSALLGPDVRGDSALVGSFNREHAGRAVVDTVELKAGRGEEAEEAFDGLPAGLVAFVEVPLDGDLEAALAVLGRRGARAKVRTGGVVPEAIPSSSRLAAFLVSCAAARLAFKATAGLHHALRADRPLTYEPGAARAVMHGFVNVLVAAALAWGGAPAGDVEAVLDGDEGDAFAFEPDGARWRDRWIPTATLAAGRSEFALSFGSCSFAEPVADLEALGVLSTERALAHPRSRV